MAKCLVTGGAGFMGAHLSKELLSEGNDVIAIDDLSGGFKENLPEGVIFIKGSILNKELIDKIIKSHNIEYIFHLAAYAAEGLSHFIKIFNYNNNLIGSVNLINSAINNGIKCFVFTSSIAVYGEGQVPMVEDEQPLPEDPYGIAKYAVELELKSSKKMFDLDYIIFRPHNVYGELQNLGDRYRNVLGIFMNQIMQGKQLTIFGDGKQTRAFTYVGDVIPVIARSIFEKKAYNQIFNIGADETYTINELSEIISRIMNVELNVMHLEARNEVMHAISSHKKLKNYFDYIPKYNLEEGITKMVNWAKKVGYRKSKNFKDIEIYKNMPPSWLSDFIET